MVSVKIDKQLQTISNYFLFSLAFADLIIGAFSLPLFTVYFIMKRWPFSANLCDAWLSIDYLASNASVWNLVMISIDRYFSVTRPLSYRARRTTKKAMMMIMSAWVLSFLLWVPTIYAYPYFDGGRQVPADDCYIQFVETNHIMSTLWAVMAFYLPVTIMCGLYVRVWWETVKVSATHTDGTSHCFGWSSISLFLLWPLHPLRLTKPLRESISQTLLPFPYLQTMCSVAVKCTTADSRPNVGKIIEILCCMNLGLERHLRAEKKLS